MDVRTFILWMTALVLIAVNLTIFVSVNPSGNSAHPWTYAEFISVSLTAVTVVLAALALGVGILAIWGFKQIEDRAKESAAVQAGDVASKRIESYLQSEEFQVLAKSALRQLEADKAVQAVTGDADGSGRRDGNARTDSDIPPRPRPAGGGGSD